MISKHLFKNNLHQPQFSSIYRSLVSNFCQIKKNQNIWSMSFNAGDWQVYLYAFYPQLNKKREKPVYEIYSKKSVMALSFMNNKLQYKKAWGQRKSIAIGYQNMVQLAQILPGSGKQMLIQSTALSQFTNTKKQKQLTILDQPSKQQILFKFKQISISTLKPKKPQQQPKTTTLEIQAAMQHSQYRLMNKLIQKSLLQFGGWKIMLDAARHKQFLAIQNIQKKQKGIDQLFLNEKTIN